MGHARRALMAIAIGTAFSPLAYAQEQTPVTVEVKGMRSANFKSIAEKRDAVSLVDTVAADEAGKLPDFNVGDVLRRVTGVATLHYQGEPRFVIVRGLNANYNTTLIDGFSLATADVGGRSMYMEVLPSNFVRRVDVVKSPLPETDGGAIGGVVNMVTGSAFNYRDGLLDISAKGGRNFGERDTGGGHPIGEAQARWASRLGEKQEFGVLATASYWSRHINVPQLESGSSLNTYTAAGVRTPAFNGGDAVPTERRWYNYDNTRERAGLTARLDWQPDGDQLKGFVGAYYFNQRESSDRYGLLAQVDASAKVTEQTPVSGLISSASQTADVGRLDWDRKLQGVNGALQAELRPQLSAELRASYSHAEVSNPQIWERFIQPGLAFRYDWSAPLHTFTAVSPNADNPSRYALAYHRIEGTDYQATVNDVQANLRFNTAEGSRGWGGAAGARSVLTRSDTVFRRTDYSGAPYTLADILSGGTLCGVACNTRIPVIDFGLADAAYARYGASEKATVDLTSQYGNTYDLRERVDALYGQLQYRAERWLVVGGLRMERTHFDSDGYQATNGSYALKPDSNRYHNWLPSVTAILDTGAESKLRLGVSETVGRPRFDQIATHGGALNTSASVPTLSTGNPDLKPRTSLNLDAGHEWYLDGGRGIVSVALFHKRIRDEIFTYSQSQSMNVNGVPTQVLVTQSRNTPDLTRLTGLEFGITKDFTFLPAPFNGLGMSVNGSLTSVRYPVRLSDGSSIMLHNLQQQPNRLFNAALYYEQGPVHAKLAWNHLGHLWDSRFPNFTPAGFIFNRYQASTNNIDMQFAYDWSKRITLSVDVLNATSQGQRYNFGPDQRYVQSAWKLYPSVLLGASIKL